MPVEIKQLVVRAVAQREGDGGSSTAPSASGGGLAQSERQALLEECVKEVLKTLRRSQER